MHPADAMQPVRRCTRCVMDTTDPAIQFDGGGVCSHCAAYDANVAQHVHSGEEGRHRLASIVDRIRKSGKGKRYDCIIGVSGGVDSTYVAWKVIDLGLRPLAVHLDNGWDSELAVKNIHNAVTRLGIDLETRVLDWEEFRDLQVAFLRASTPDAEIPSDHAIIASLVSAAEKAGVGSVISGANHRTESHLPPAWSRGHLDWRYIRSVHEAHGSRPLKTFPHLGFFKSREYQTGSMRLDILDYLDYSRDEAKAVITAELGWQDYGGKHHESIYTRFYQGYFLPRKFGFDKRKSHLSSLVCSGQITRDEALIELEQPPYPVEQQEADRIYVMKKLRLSEDELAAIMSAEPRSFWDYPSYAALTRAPAYRNARSIFRGIRALAGSRPAPAT
jgi:N-acetyl sugar amidotransferase